MHIQYINFFGMEATGPDAAFLVRILAAALMAYGFAWDDPADPDSGGMRHRKALVLATAGASEQAFAKRGYDSSLHTQLNVGTWDYCGMKDVTTRILHDLHHETPEEDRKARLAEAKSLARGFLG